MIGQEDRPPFIQHLEVALGDPEQVATMELKMQTLEQQQYMFSHYCAASQDIAADLDWNHLAL
jgi:hypothetical protein